MVISVSKGFQIAGCGVYIYIILLPIVFPLKLYKPLHCTYLLLLSLHNFRSCIREQVQRKCFVMIMEHNFNKTRKGNVVHEIASSIPCSFLSSLAAVLFIYDPFYGLVWLKNQICLTVFSGSLPYWILKTSAHLFRHWCLVTGRHDLHISVLFYSEMNT